MHAHAWLPWSNQPSHTHTRRLYETSVAVWLNSEPSLMATAGMMLPEVAEYEVSPHKHCSGSISAKQKVLEAERLLGVRADLLSACSQSGALLSYSFIWWGVKGEPSYAICNPALCTPPPPHSESHFNDRPQSQSSISTLCSSSLHANNFNIWKTGKTFHLRIWGWSSKIFSETERERRGETKRDRVTDADREKCL